jgi:hypothetical protein
MPNVGVDPEQGGLMRRLVPFGVAALLFSARLTWAGPSDIAVRMKCPVLSDVSAAEFEARAKVDLSVRAIRGGELEVVCDGLAAHVRWREQGGAWVARSMPPTATPAALVDALLVASKELIEGTSREEGGARDAGEKDGTATSGAPGAASAPPNPDPRSAGRWTKKAAEGGDAPSKGRAEASDSSSGEPAGSENWVWSISAGASGALFSVSGTGIVGPSVGVVAQMPAGISASLTGEYDVAIGAGDTVSVRVASVAAVISRTLGPSRAFEVGAGGFVGGVFASSEAPYQPTSRSQAFWGGILRGRYAVRAEAWRFAVGPDIRFYGFRPDVAVDGAYVWGVPAVSAGLSLEVSRAVYGSK